MVSEKGLLGQLLFVARLQFEGFRAAGRDGLLPLRIVAATGRQDRFNAFYIVDAGIAEK